jgi:hypothetical protein
VPLPRNPPWPRLLPALLLAAFALAPPARAADGFTEIGIDAPDPIPHAVRPSLLADEDPILPAASDDAEWAAWWREWRGWTPFAAQEPETPPSRDRDDGSRLGGAAMPQSPGPFLAFGNAVPLFIASTPARGPSTASTPSTTTTTATGPGTEQEEETITLTEIVPPSLLVEPPPVPPAPVIGEPASMALLGGALAVLGLLRRRRPTASAG